VLVLPFRDHTYLRLVSARTGETLIELKMIGSGVIVWGQPSDQSAIRVCGPVHLDPADLLLHD
jgi:hypothetical protein